MKRIADFAARVWRGAVALAKALNHALAVAPPPEHEDTVFQPRDPYAAGKASGRETR